MSSAARVQVVGRYALYDVIASGGMARVHFGRLLGAVGFARTVAVKRMLAPTVGDPEVAAMFLDEARLASRIRHPNVVPVLDVVDGDGEILLVLEYVDGESLGRLLRRMIASKEPAPPAVAAAVVCDLLAGLHAAHEAADERGDPLRIVHRDVSPENVLVAADGHARVTDFGIAKARGRARTTQDGRVKGKLAYMPPEQLRGVPLDRRADVYAAGVVLWEMLAGDHLFDADDEGALAVQVLEGAVPSTLERLAARDVPVRADDEAAHRRLDAVIRGAVARAPGDRFPTAAAMADAVRAAVTCAGADEVARWLEHHAAEALGRRRARVHAIESEDAPSPAPEGRPGAAAVSEPPMLTLAGTTKPLTQVATPAPRPRRATAAVLAAVAATSVFAAVVAVAVAGYAWSRARATPAPAAASEAIPSTSSSAPLAVEGAAPEVAPRATPAAASSASSASTASSAAAAPRKARSARAHAAAPTSCSPPYTFDADGAKHYKADCL